MTAIAIPPITGQEIERKYMEVTQAFQDPRAARLVDGWARLVTASSILDPVDISRMSDPDRQRLSDVSDNLDFLMAHQSEEVAECSYPSPWGVGQVAVYHTLEQTRERILNGSSSANWLMGESRLNGLLLQTAKTMLHLERFDDLLAAQPEGTILTEYPGYFPTRAHAVALDPQQRIYTAIGSGEMVIPPYLDTSAVNVTLTPDGEPITRLVDVMSMNVDAIVAAVEDSNIYPIEDLEDDSAPLRAGLFLGHLPDGAAWVKSEGMDEDTADFYERRFELVKAASARALGLYDYSQQIAGR